MDHFYLDYLHAKIMYGHEWWQGLKKSAIKKFINESHNPYKAIASERG